LSSDTEMDNNRNRNNRNDPNLGNVVNMNVIRQILQSNNNNNNNNMVQPQQHQQQQAMVGLQEMLLSAALQSAQQQPQRVQTPQIAPPQQVQIMNINNKNNKNNNNSLFNNDDMFKIDPNLDIDQMASHLYSCFEQESTKRIRTDDNSTLFRILLIAENVNDNIIRIDVDDDDDDIDMNGDGMTHLEKSVNSAIKAIAFTNNKYLLHGEGKKVLFTAQMRRKKKIDLILDCFHPNSMILTFLKRCNNSRNAIFVDHKAWTVHNLAKNIIAQLNQNKFTILIPRDMKAVHVIVESMIVAHTAIKSQFKSIANHESFWLYCLIETNQPNLPVLSHQISNWTFKIVMNNNY